MGNLLGSGCYVRGEREKWGAEWAVSMLTAIYFLAYFAAVYAAAYALFLAPLAREWRRVKREWRERVS